MGRKAAGKRERLVKYSELHFSPTPRALADFQAVVFFGNGYGVSVVRGGEFVEDGKNDVVVLERDPQNSARWGFATDQTGLPLSKQGLDEQGVEAFMDDIEKNGIETILSWYSIRPAMRWSQNTWRETPQEASAR